MNLNGEMDEFQRVSQDLSRDENVDISVDEIVSAFKESEEQILDDNIWGKLENTESNNIKKGDYESVKQIAKKYNKTNPKILAKSIRNDDYDRPLIINLGNRYILVAGNTRLSTAAALGVKPKVFIAKVGNMKKIEAQEMTGADSSGAFESSFSSKPMKRKITKLNNSKDYTINENSVDELIGQTYWYRIGSGDEKNNEPNEKDYVYKKLSTMIKHNFFDWEFYYNYNDGDEKNLYFELFKHEILLPLLKNIDKTLEKYFIINKDKKIISWGLSREKNQKFIDGFFIENENISKQLRDNYIEYRQDYAGVDILGNNEVEMKEATLSDSSGQYDTSFSSGRKDPLAIEGPSSIMKSRAVKDKNFPKWGGPGSVFVKVKEKCKKFPYCNQGDIKSLEMFEINGLNETIEKVSVKHNVSKIKLENIVLGEIKKIM